jgi:hypothetical protein
VARPLVSILLPHLRERPNDAALQIALSCIVDNTSLDYELIMEAVEERRDIYGVLNGMAQRANSEWIIPHNSDVFVGPGWLEPLYEARDLNAIVSPVMVECGAIGVAPVNLPKDFGKTPDTFRRDEFEAWVRAGGEMPGVPGGVRRWYFPSLLPRRPFLDMGGFDIARGTFPNDTVDIWFWDKWEAAGKEFRAPRSFVYHLQAYSSAFEQAKRHGA